MAAVLLAACGTPPPAVTPTPIQTPTAVATSTPTPADPPTASPTVTPSTAPPSFPSAAPTSGEPTFLASPSSVPSVSPPVSPGATTSPSFPSSSPSADASGEPTPTGGTILEIVRDDFGDRRSGFPTLDDETQLVTYDEGRLRLQLKLPGRATWSARRIGDWPAASVTATFTVGDAATTGFYGLTCGSDQRHFLAGVVGSDGSALLLRVDDGAATPLGQVAGAFSPPAAGGTVRLDLGCIGTEVVGTGTIRLAINGSIVATATDPSASSSFRMAGLYAESAASSETFAVHADDFVVLVSPRPSASGGPTASPPLTGDPLADALAAHVPEPLRATCRRTDPPETQELVAVDCPTSDVPSAVYLQYASTEAMAADFSALVSSHPEATGSGCAVGPGTGPYTVDGVEVGRLLCFEQFGVAWFAWTDERLDIMVVARRADTSFPLLYQWWLLAGPTL